MTERDDAVAEFVAVMRRLRAECPWKREQTHRSLARYLLEETHEALEAMDTGDADHLREELGDLLLQVVFHAVIAEESGAFGLDDVARDVTAKMHRRNPHVFGSDRSDGADGSGSGAGPARGTRPRSTSCGSRSRRSRSSAPTSPRGCRRASPRCSTPTRSSTAAPARAARSRRPPRPTSATGCSRWSPRRARPGSTRSRRCATPCAGSSEHPGGSSARRLLSPAAPPVARARPGSG